MSLLDLQGILERFSLISGLSAEEASLWEPLLIDAKEELECKLKDYVDTVAEARRLNVAAAALGFYKYTLYKVSGAGMGSFSAGDISINLNNKEILNAALNIWLEAKATISDLLKDDDFLFKIIREE